jgi:fatty-acid desaturase
MEQISMDLKPHFPSKMTFADKDAFNILSFVSKSRIIDSQTANAQLGQVVVSRAKVLWLGSMFLLAIMGGILTFTWDALLLFVIFTAFTLCFGHSLGMHRRLIHQSFACPLWLEYCLIHLGVIVGLAGPFGMIRTHDLRDWAQRQAQCHDFLGHQQPAKIDVFWQLFCDLQLQEPPQIDIEPRISQDRVYQWMEKTWMWQQLPWAILFYVLGGLPWVFWGICMRVVVSVLGHWMIGYFAHNHGEQHWQVSGAQIQGHNVKFASLLTMGESWHNNHHAFPGSAKLGIEQGQWDPGWWVLISLKKLGLVWDLVLPEDLSPRPELVLVAK